MTQEIPNLDAQTLEYVHKLLMRDWAAYNHLREFAVTEFAQGQMRKFTQSANLSRKSCPYYGCLGTHSRRRNKMENEIPTLYVPTLEYVISMLNDDIKDYNKLIDRTDDDVKRNKYRAIGNYIAFVRDELRTIIEEQQEE